MSAKKDIEKQSEAAIRLNAIFKNAIDGIITINHKGIVEEINPAAATLFGYSPEDVIGQNVKMLMPEPYHSEHDTYIQNYHNTGKPRIIGIGREVKGKRKDGTVFPFFLSVSKIMLDDKIIFSGIIHDITELKAKEEQLEESRNQLKSIFESAVDGIVIIDEKGIMQMVNPAVAKLFGYQDEDLAGNNVSMLTPRLHHFRHDGYIQKYLQTGKAGIIGIGREVMGLKKDGSQFPFSLSVSEMKLKDKILFAGIIHDLTEQKKAEDKIHKLNENLEQKVADRTEKLSQVVNKLLETNKKLESEVQERRRIEEALRQTEMEIREALKKEKELSELKSRFVSLASHEFRTPLSTILSSAALIGRYTESDQQDKRSRHIERIKTAVSNLTGILNDFLSLSKLEEGKVENNPTRFHLAELHEEVIDQLQGLLKKDQKIEHKGEASSLEVFLDKRLLKNVLINLLSNAIKYSGEGKTVLLEEHVEGDQLIVKVADQGMGIPQADQQHLFTRFFRATNVINIQGTGLGLNIVKRYINLMGGTISFKSEEGKGSTFTLIVPVRNKLN